MKDVTSTSFGLIIAYLMPGLAALYGTTFWAGKADEILQRVIAGESDLSLALLIAGSALLLGLLLNVLRWLFFERFVCRHIKLSPQVFAAMKDEHRLQTFVAVIEETFRYHQFFGNMAVLIPFLYLSWLKWYDSTLLQRRPFLAWTAVFFLLEFASGIVSINLRDGGAGIRPYLHGSICIAKVLILSAWVRGILLVCMPVILPAVYLMILKVLFSGMEGKYSLYLSTVVFVLWGLALGANATAALERYVKRGDSIGG